MSNHAELGSYNNESAVRILRKPFQYGEMLMDIAMIFNQPVYLSQFPAIEDLANQLRDFGENKVGPMRGSFDNIKTADAAIVIAFHRAKQFLTSFVENDQYGRIFFTVESMELEPSQFPKSTGPARIEFLDHIISHTPKVTYTLSSEDEALLQTIAEGLRKQPPTRNKTEEVRAL